MGCENPDFGFVKTCSFVENPDFWVCQNVFLCRKSDFLGMSKRVFFYIENPDFWIYVKTCGFVENPDFLGYTR